MTVGIKVDLAAGIVTGDAVNFGTDTLRSVEGINGTLLDDIYDATGFGANSVNVMSRGIGVNEFEGGAGNDIIIGNGSTRISYVRSTQRRHRRYVRQQQWCASRWSATFRSAPTPSWAA